jgi:hypothetical protein
VLLIVLGDYLKLIYGENAESYEFILEKILIGDFKLVFIFVSIYGRKSNALEVWILSSYINFL